MKRAIATSGILQLLTLLPFLIPTFPQLAIADSGSLKIRVVDEGGALLPCRAWVDQSNKRLFIPSQPPSTTPYERDQSFSCDGWFEMVTPAGQAIVHIEKGKEWFPKNIPVEIKANRVTEYTVTMDRWIDLRSKNFYSSDLHIHFGNNNPRILEQLGAADDLDIIPAFSYWLRGTEEEWKADWPHWPSGSTIETQTNRIITRNNLEIERISSRAQPGGSVGASFLFNLQTPLSVDHYDTRFPTDADLCLLARAISPGVVIDTDKPSWAETVVGAILGAYDTVQVCHNHYHRRQTIPGGWGMIGPIAEHEKDLREENELFHRTNEQYYSFLNCGLRLAVSGGSAIGVMPVPAGYNRVYAEVSGPLTAQKFWQAVRQGKSFATSGPMLFLDINNTGLGDHIDYHSDEKRELSINIEVRSIDKLQSLDVVHNGQVIRQIALDDSHPNPILKSKHTFKHFPSRSGWYAGRAIYESPQGHLRQAHTSPIYLTVDGKPTASKRDADYMIHWIDQLLEIANQPDRFQSQSNRKEVIETYQRAKDAYRSVSALAEEIWND
jgi:hypothetical protein